MPVADPSGNMIIDIGGGTTEVAVISLNGIVVARSLRVGGNRFDEAIANYIKRKYNLRVGERTAEEVKIAIGSAMPVEEDIAWRCAAATKSPVCRARSRSTPTKSPTPSPSRWRRSSARSGRCSRRRHPNSPPTSSTRA